MLVIVHLSRNMAAQTLGRFRVRSLASWTVFERASRYPRGKSLLPTVDRTQRHGSKGHTTCFHSNVKNTYGGERVIVVDKSQRFVYDVHSVLP